MKQIYRIKHGNTILWQLGTLAESLRIVNGSASANTCTMTKNGSANAVNMEYSLDGTNWSTWTADSSGNRSVSIPANGTLYLRGDNPNGFSRDNDTDYYNITCSGSYSLAGDIRSLITNYATDSLPVSAFRRMFKDSTTLTDASELKLSAEFPSERAYLHLFNGCTSLVRAPKLLPAGTSSNIPLASGVYGYMFYGCTSLTTMPYIAGRYFGNQSCYEMFRGCTALNDSWNGWESEITNTFGKVYLTIESVSGIQNFYNMFLDCTSLTDASLIDGRAYWAVWGQGACYQMFRGCTAMTEAPNFVFNTFSGIGSYDCNHLVTVPQVYLNAATVYQQTYKGMFRGCTRLTTAPEIKATSLVDEGTNHENSSLAYMLYGCTALHYLHVNFTNWNSGHYTTQWTYNVKSYGQFDSPASLLPKTKNSSDSTTSTNYIPYNFGIGQIKLVASAVAESISSTQITLTLYVNGWTTPPLGPGDKPHWYINYGSTEPSAPSSSSYMKTADYSTTYPNWPEVTLNISGSNKYIKIICVCNGYETSNVVSLHYTV